MSGTVAEYQQRQLREAAEERGAVDDLLYFHAIRGDAEALQTLAPQARGNAADALVLNLLSGASADALKAEVEASNDPWVYYSVAKVLLGEARVQDAFDVMEAGLRRADGDVSTINLLVRYLVNAGAGDTAISLVDVSLGLAPDQYDLVELKNDLSAGRTRQLPIYLDPMPRAPSLAFYLPVYNVERFVRRALEGILSLNYPLQAVYVVDDGTPDDSIRIAEEFPVAVLRHKANRGLAAARNTAFRHADTDYLGAIDTDAYPDPGYAKYAMMELEQAGPDVAGVGGRLEELDKESPADLWRALHLSQDPGPARIHPPRFLYGSNTIYARERVLEVGAYDERYRANSEDGDIARKLHAGGYTFTATPNARAFHMRRDTPDSALRTLWGWAKAHREDHGILDSFRSVLEEMPTTLNQAVNLINDDAGDPGRNPAVYLDFLYIFHCSFQNLLHCVDNNLAAPGAVRYIQNTMLGSLEAFDAARGGKAGGRAHRDVEHMLVDAAPASLDGDEAALFEAFMVELRKVYDAINSDLYNLLEG